MNGEDIVLRFYGRVIAIRTQTFSTENPVPTSLAFLGNRRIIQCPIGLIFCELVSNTSFYIRNGGD